MRTLLTTCFMFTILVVPSTVWGQEGIEVGPRLELDVKNIEEIFIGVDAHASAPSRPILTNPTLDSFLAEHRMPPGYKDPNTALLFGVLFTGGGHFYSGETTKGLILLGGAVGAVVVGAALSTQTCYTTVFSTFCEPANYTPLYIGALIATGAWVYGMVDADNAAMRANERNGLSVNVRPVPVTVAGTQHSVRPGLSVQIRW